MFILLKMKCYIFTTTIFLGYFHKLLLYITAKKTKISEGNLAKENMKSLSNFVTKFCDQGLCEILFFPSLTSLTNFAFPSSICVYFL